MVIAVSRFLLPVDHVRRGRGGFPHRRVVQPRDRLRARAGAAVQELRRPLLALLLCLVHILSESAQRKKCLFRDQLQYKTSTGMSDFFDPLLCLRLQSLHCLSAN